MLNPFDAIKDAGCCWCCDAWFYTVFSMLITLVNPAGLHCDQPVRAVPWRYTCCSEPYWSCRGMDAGLGGCVLKRPSCSSGMLIHAFSLVFFLCSKWNYKEWPFQYQCPFIAFSAGLVWKPPCTSGSAGMSARVERYWINWRRCLVPLIFHLTECQELKIYLSLTKK